MAADILQNIEPPKTFVVISGQEPDLAVALAMLLSEQKQNLHDRFNGSQTPDWHAMLSHFESDINKEELLASMEAVLGKPRNHMMILSGYQDTDDWNSALNEFISHHNVCPTFLSFGNGIAVSPEIEGLFLAKTHIDFSEENALGKAYNTLRDAREKSTVPLPSENARPSRAKPMLQ